jgi:hypothetical protein
MPEPDLYPAGRDPLHGWAFRRKHQIQFEGETVVLAPAEYVIVRKLEYYRQGGSEKHLRDIRSIITVSGEQLDRPTLTEWIEKLGLQAEWRVATPPLV